MASIALARPQESIDEAWSAAALAVAGTGVLVMADQIPVVGLLVVLAAAATGAAIGRWRRPTTWALPVLLGAEAVIAVVFATLPDTEGATLLGAALVPVAVGALVRRTAWRGAAAGAALGALASAVAVVAIDGAAGRSGSLVVAVVAGLVCAALVVLVLRAVGRRPVPLTSEPGRPSP